MYSLWVDTIVFNNCTGNNLKVDTFSYQENIEDAIAREYLTKSLEVLWEKTDNMQELSSAVEE